MAAGAVDLPVQLCDGKSGVRPVRVPDACLDDRRTVGTSMHALGYVFVGKEWH